MIATKFGHILNEEQKFVYRDDDQILSNVRTDVESNLRRLQTDYIDVYQLHAGDYDPERALELRGILEDLVGEGKIRWYGWSTDLVDRAQVFADGEHCASIQFQLNAIFDNAEMRALCEEKRPGRDQQGSPEQGHPDRQVHARLDLSKGRHSLQIRLH